MGMTSIEWCSYTFNHVRGCSKVNLGCQFCYAEVNRSVKIHGVKWGTEKQGGTRVRLSDAGWKEPLIWNRKAVEGQCQDCNGGKARRTHESGYGYEHCETCGGTGRVEPYRSRVFCASLADVFESWDGPILNHSGIALWRHPHDENPQLYLTKQMNEEWVPVTMDDLRADLFRLIDATPNLTWMLLTKRPENIRDMIERTVGVEWWLENCRDHCWLGTSCSDQETFDESVDHLAKCGDLTPVKFVSAEPLIAGIDMSRHLGIERDRDDSWRKRTKFCESSLIDLCITGGESGPNARPCNVDWIRDIGQQCQAAGVAWFNKQLGSRPVWPMVKTQIAVDDFAEMPEWGEMRDPKGGNMDEWPEDLRVRQMPTI